MTIQKWGGIAAITEALTYLFGFVFFFAILDTSGVETPMQRLEFLLNHRDYYFLGYLVVGVLFSFALIVLVQAVHHKFTPSSPQLMKFASVVGYFWAFIVLSSSLIFLTSLSILANFYTEDPDHALAVHRATNIVVDALGGGIELVGAIWVLAISYVGLKYTIYSKWLHYWGLLIAVAGILTLLSGLSIFADNPFFEATTAIFGLGQIIWFIALGVALLRDKQQQVAL